MKKFFVPGILAIIIIFGFVFQRQLYALVEPTISYSSCDTPIAFSIGEIDPRFNITKEKLIEDANIAANIWGPTQNRQLFVYDPKATDFTINMVYDSRQALTSEISELNKNLKEKQGDIDPQIAQFKRAQADFEKRVTALNDSIKFWNEKGGAPQDEYEKLIAEQTKLREEADTLNETAQILGQKASEYNVNADKLNNTIEDYQQLLEFKPEEGLYEQEGSKRKISIFIDVSGDEFLHTLAHEMGHALGLGHDTDKESIMYPQTTTILFPSKSDIAALAEVCKKRTIFEIAGNRLIEIAQILEKRLQESLSK